MKYLALINAMSIDSYLDRAPGQLGVKPLIKKDCKTEVHEFDSINELSISLNERLVNQEIKSYYIPQLSYDKFEVYAHINTPIEGIERVADHNEKPDCYGIYGINKQTLRPIHIVSFTDEQKAVEVFNVLNSGNELSFPQEAQDDFNQDSDMSM